MQPLPQAMRTRHGLCSHGFVMEPLTWMPGYIHKPVPQLFNLPGRASRFAAGPVDGALAALGSSHEKRAVVPVRGREFSQRDTGRKALGGRGQAPGYWSAGMPEPARGAATSPPARENTDASGGEKGRGTNRNNRNGATRRVVRNVGRDNAPCVVTYFFAAFLTFLASFFWAGVFRGSFFVLFFASCVLAIFVFLLATHGRPTVFLRTHYAQWPAPWLYFFSWRPRTRGKERDGNRRVR